MRKHWNGAGVRAENPFCAVRPQGVRHQLPRTGLEATLWIFDAVPGGNGSASEFRLMFAKLHLDLHLPSTYRVNLTIQKEKINVY
jgi:hypothetical protein